MANMLNRHAAFCESMPTEKAWWWQHYASTFILKNKDSGIN